MQPVSEMKKTPNRLSDAAEMELNKTIKNLCEFHYYLTLKFHVHFG